MSNDSKKVKKPPKLAENDFLSVFKRLPRTMQEGFSVVARLELARRNLLMINEHLKDCAPSEEIFQYMDNVYWCRIYLEGVNAGEGAKDLDYNIMKYAYSCGYIMGLNIENIQEKDTDEQIVIFNKKWTYYPPPYDKVYVMKIFHTQDEELHLENIDPSYFYCYVMGQATAIDGRLDKWREG